ncbi:MAG TPA: FeoA family protein [Phycisphaerae bacterium]|nr:FeoA family protein [Phycisphaerae bacterium]HRY69372.1 FeoA family protein [Phycisphaerae bacterium]HSA26239.1 FeoA family protein [Phycisphaerae bacterium]
MRTTCFPLAHAPAGCDVRIQSIRMADVRRTQRLRELGLIEGRTVRPLTNCDPMICQVGNCRLGLCRAMARAILVEPLPMPDRESP